MLDGVTRLAFIGVAKNCGKTTTLNYVLGSSLCNERCVGLISVGIDGESADLLLGTPKPAIYARVGQWVITARDALEKSSARLEYAASLGFSTPLGEVFCGRVLAPGNIILAGIRHSDDLAAGIDALESHGVDLTLIDGAYGRTIAARGELSNAVIVSTGAVLSPKIEVICARTTALLKRLSPGPITTQWEAGLIQQAINDDRFLLGGENLAPRKQPTASALLGLRELSADNLTGVEAVAIPGLVSDGVSEQLLSLPSHPNQPRALLVPDGTVLQAKPRLLKKFGRTWHIRALAPANILAVSINPSSPRGHEISGIALSRALREHWPDLTCFDPSSCVH